MVLIRRKLDNCITYAFDLTLEEVKLGDKVTELKDLIINDMNKTTAELIEVPSIPEDFVGGKYKYVNNQFELNPEY